MNNECNLCGWICPTDLNTIRKKRHELGMHRMDRTIYSERDGSPSKPMGNHIYGKVKWI